MAGEKPKPKQCHVSKEEREDRVDFVVEKLALGYRKSLVKKSFRRKFGATPARTFEDYLARARGKLRETMNEDPDSLRCEALAFYRAVRGTPGVDWQVRVKCQERVDKLMGTEIKTLAPEPLERILAQLDPRVAEPLRRALSEALRQGEGPGRAGGGSSVSGVPR